MLASDSRVVAAGKGGVAYLLDKSDLGHEGGEIASTELGSSAFGAAAVLGSMLFVPCSRALVGLHVSEEAIEVAWTVPGGAGPPIVAAGAVWYSANNGGLNAVDPASGESLFSVSLDRPVSRFVSPCAGGGQVFVPDGETLLAFSLH